MNPSCTYVHAADDAHNHSSPSNERRHPVYTHYLSIPSRSHSRSVVYGSRYGAKSLINATGQDRSAGPQNPLPGFTLTGLQRPRSPPLPRPGMPMAQVAAQPHHALALAPAAGGGDALGRLAAKRRGRGEVDTSSPFESVRQAVDRFGGGAVSPWRHPPAPPPLQLRPEVSQSVSQLFRAHQPHSSLPPTSSIIVHTGE